MPGILGGTVQRRENTTVVTIEGSYHSVSSVLAWMQTNMPYPRTVTSKVLIIKPKYEQFRVLRSHPEPRSELSSGNVVNEGSSVSSVSDGMTQAESAKPGFVLHYRPLPTGLLRSEKCLRVVV